jgi:hypothetical protein
MPNYTEAMKRHLSRYRVERLQVMQEGRWRKGKKYAHIIPRRHGGLNILETVRAEFWEYAKQKKLKRHTDFHHLNSSQAMCFNLFFPLFGMPPGNPNILAEALGVGPAQATRWQFEKMLDTNERTSFDFFLERKDATDLLFELKLTEGEFGKAKAVERRKRKLGTLYRPMLQGKVKDDALKEEVFFANYQLLRNVGYLDLNGNRLLFIIFPRKHQALLKAWKTFSALLASSTTKLVRVVHLEDLVKRIRKHAGDMPARMTAHYELFAEKYII